MKKRKLMLIIGVFLLGISTVYAVTIIRASDVTYDNSKSKGNSSNVQGAIDELYSISDGSCSSGGSSSSTKNNLINYITNLAKTDTTNLAYDDTTDKNLRYIGANPNNYVLFNDELWRIIGIMNNVKDSDGNNASRVKLIRDETIGKLAWDTSNANDWSNASVQKILNSGEYYNRSGSYSSNGLSEESKSMISNVTWNLGGHTLNKEITSKFYEIERQSKVYSGRSATWTGYVGLMYPSDYGYAVGGDVRNTCLTSLLYEYPNNKCYQNDWLYKNSTEWLMTPRYDVGHAIFYLFSSGAVNANDYAKTTYTIRPVVYLNTNIKRVSGKGTSDDPYVITNQLSNTSDTSNASPPKLDADGKLIPVILADDGKVSMVSEEDENWYNYGEKKWANAVILIDSPSKTYKEGDIISESDIESYFVWIPKYKYRLWNTGTASKKAHEIDIVFDIKNTTDVEGESCKTPMTSGATGNCNNGEYMTHPAFISLGVDGFWVGKFETGYKGAMSTAAAQVNGSDSSKIIIKPNVYSWRSNTVYNFFVSAYNYERSLDSHMMKNTEWGAVAYLSHSKYGINNEININNNSSFKTGYSSLPTLDQHTYPGTYGDGTNYNEPYNTNIGHLASTTGNITGVYDMSGGAHDYMASYMDGQLGESEFTTTTLANYNAMYFDKYSAKSTATSFQYRILGDATGELGPFFNYVDDDDISRPHNSWYADDSRSLDSVYPWVYRGGKYNLGSLSGQLYFYAYSGSSSFMLGSRIVLSP